MKLLLVDRSSIFRMGMRAALAAAPGAGDLKVVGECEDGATASAHGGRARRRRWSSRTWTWVTATASRLARQLGHKAPAARVLILASHGPEAIVHQALGAGAAGYALKGQAADEMVAAIRSVGLGELVLPGGVGRPPPRAVGGGEDRSPPTRSSGCPARAADLRPGGLGELEQADRGRLGISIKTVETHRGHINGKLRVHTSADIVRLASLWGMLPSAGPSSTNGTNGTRASSEGLPSSEAGPSRGALTRYSSLLPPTFSASVWRVMPRCCAASVRLPPQISSTRRMWPARLSSSVGMAAPPTAVGGGRRAGAPPAPRRPARPAGAPVRSACRRASARRG